MTGDGGTWLRKQCLILSRNNHTGVDFWLQRPLWELGRWIESNNALVREEEKRNGRK